jgi:hypothetical protein
MWRNRRDRPSSHRPVGLPPAGSRRHGLRAGPTGLGRPPRAGVLGLWSPRGPSRGHAPLLEHVGVLGRPSPPSRDPRPGAHRSGVRTPGNRHGRRRAPRPAAPRDQARRSSPGASARSDVTAGRGISGPARGSHRIGGGRAPRRPPTRSRGPETVLPPPPPRTVRPPPQGQAPVAPRGGRWDELRFRWIEEHAWGACVGSGSGRTGSRTSPT